MPRIILRDALNIDFFIVGISCHLRDYRLCWHLNNQLGISLARHKDTIDMVHRKNEPPTSHARFDYQDEDARRDFKLLVNRTPGGYLLPEEKKADYLLILHHFEDEGEVLTLIQRLRKVEPINHAYLIDAGNLKNTENLILE